MHISQTATKVNTSLFHLPVIVIALLIGVAQGLRASSGQWENILIMALIVLLMTWDSRGRMSPRRPAVPVAERVFAWLALALAPCFLLIPGSAIMDLNANGIVLLLALALCAFQRGSRTALWSLPPLLLSLVVIPLQEYVFLSFSYALRLLSTILSCEIIQLFTDSISYFHTTIYVDSTTIAITDACSGISQLYALFLLAYLIVRRRHQQLRWALLHFASLLPVVVIANALRLIVTIGLYQRIGDTIFNDFYHTLFGILLVIVTVALLIAVGLLFPGKNTTPESPELPEPTEPPHA